MPWYEISIALASLVGGGCIGKGGFVCRMYSAAKAFVERLRNEP